MAEYCEDCGTKMYGGVCSNCQEELYILDNQSEDMLQPVSDDFIEKAIEQCR